MSRTVYSIACDIEVFSFDKTLEITRMHVFRFTCKRYHG